jgi:hypothetical protein
LFQVGCADVDEKMVIQKIQKCQKQNYKYFIVVEGLKRTVL